MPPPPFFSICIPCFNAQRFLRETLESVRSQTYGNWELLVVEDGSSEPCAEAVDAFRATVTQPVRYLVHPVNRGLPATRDTAIAAARGTHVALLDADDAWLPNHLEALAASIATSDADLTFGGFQMFEDSTGRELGRFVPSAEDLADLPGSLFHQRSWVIPSCIAVRSEFLGRIGPWSAGLELRSGLLGKPGGRGEDTNFWMRAFHADAKWCYSAACTVRYRRHPTSMSGRRADTVLPQSLVYNAHGPAPQRALNPQREHISRLNASAARLLCSDGDRRAAVFFWWAWTWRRRRLVYLALAPAAFVAPRLLAAGMRLAGHAL